MLTSKIDSLILQEFYNRYNSETNSYIDILKEEKANPYLKYCFYVGNNKILGYITYLDIYDRFEISNIYVLREFRGNGIASKMLQFVIYEGLNKKINNITLEVNSKNTSAIALYHKYGFKEVAIRSGYYSGTDGILMEKEMI
jgi:SSU ribosomal protein S18P alanine acetyltransferase